MQRRKVEQEPDVYQPVGPCRGGYAEGQTGSDSESFLQEVQAPERKSGEQALWISSGHENIGRCDAVEQSGEHGQTSVLKDNSAEGVQGDYAQQKQCAVAQSHRHQQPAPHTQPAAQRPKQRLRQAPEQHGEEREECKVVLIQVSSLGDEEEMLSIPAGEAAEQPLHRGVQVEGLICPGGHERISTVVRDDSIEGSLGR